MKKVFTFLLVAVVLVSCMATSVFAANASISVSSATAKPGDTVTLSFSLSGNTGFSFYQGKITYDKSALELKEITELKGFMAKDLNNGQVACMAAPAIEDDGVLFEATFKVLDGAQDSTVSFSVDVFGDETEGANSIGSVSPGIVKVLCEHESLTPVAQVDASCSATGTKAHYKCTCGKLFSDAAGTTAVTLESLKIAATGHKWNSGEVTTQPGCESKGVKTFTCTVSGCGETQTEDIAATGHTPKAAVKENIVAAGCETNGSYDSVVYCEKCNNEVSREKGIVIPATGHTFSDPVVTKKPTCVEEGVETGTCGSCGKTTTQSVAALGHKYDDGKVTIAPTCVDKGVRTFTCSACAEGTTGHSYTEEVAALGHKYDNGKVTTAPTCVDKGVKTFTCPACAEGTTGHSYTEEVAALGHKYDNGKVTTEPTCTEKGEKLFTCSVCEEGTEGHTKTEVVAATGHAFDQWTEIKAPTCIVDGEESHECVTCGHKETRPVEALGHKYDKGEVIKEATKTEKGTKKYTCSVCGYSYEAEYALGNKDNVLGMGDITMNIALAVMAVTALFGTAIVVKRKAVK